MMEFMLYFVTNSFESFNSLNKNPENELDL